MSVVVIALSAACAGPPDGRDQAASQTCDDPLANNAGSPPPCTYDCADLRREYFPAPWGKANEIATAFESSSFYLVDCDRPLPDLPEDANTIRIPPARVATTSTTQIPHFVSLDVVDRLAGHNRLDFIYDPTVRARVEAGEIVEIGDGVRLNPESLIELQPDLVIATTIGNPDLNALGVLERVGAPTAIDAAFMEATPLGRAEWIKLVAAFFNREAEANAVFDDIAAHYEELRSIAAAQHNRPRVLVGTPFQGTWHVSGGDGYQAKLIADAGGDYLWSDEGTRGALSLDFETVYAVGLEADVWLHAYGWQSLAAGLRSDVRMGDFAAFREGRVSNNDTRISEGGGNDYWETGSLRPDVILADLVAILHPDALPDHELVFHRRLAPNDAD